MLIADTDDRPEPPELLDPALVDVLEWVRFEALKETETMAVLARLLDAEALARTGMSLMQNVPSRRGDILQALLIRAERNGARERH